MSIRRLALLTLFAATCTTSAVAFADGTDARVDQVVDASTAKPDGGGDNDDGIATSPGAVPPSGGAVTPAPDPTKDLGGTIKAVSDAKDHGGYVAAGVLLLYILASMALRLKGHVGWLAEDRHLAIVTGIAGMLGALADHFTNGANWQTVIAAASTAVATYLFPLHPNAKDGSATTTGEPTGLQPQK